MNTSREKFLFFNPDAGTDSGNVNGAQQFPISSFLGVHSVSNSRVNLEFLNGSNGEINTLRVEIEDDKVKEFCSDLANEIAYGKDSVINIGDEAELTSFSSNVDIASTMFSMTNSHHGVRIPVGPQIVVKTASFSLTEADHAGTTIHIGSLGGNCTVSMPVASQEGVMYRFIGFGTGSAAEAQEVIFDLPDDAAQFDGGVVFLDTDNEISAVHGNGTSNDRLTINNNAMFDIQFYGKLNGDFMVTGYVVSADAPAFSDQD